MMIFDIETASNAKALAFLPEPEAPGNYKDPEKIEQYIEQKRMEQIDRAALDPDYGKVIAIGLMDVETKSTTSMLVSDWGGDEKIMLEDFWVKLRMHNNYSCGYNIINFDLPYLQRRSFALGSYMAVLPVIRRYATTPTLDLMQVLFNWSTPKSLKFVADRYGLDNPLPGIDGSMVKDMDDDTLRKYVENDVNLTYQLYERMRGYYF